MNVNYNFLTKIFSELTPEQKIKLSKNLQNEYVGVTKTGQFWLLGQDSNLRPID